MEHPLDEEPLKHCPFCAWEGHTLKMYCTNRVLRIADHKETNCGQVLKLGPLEGGTR